MELLGYFTEKGTALSAKLLTGTALTITRVAAGDGETALSAAALERERQTLAVSAMRRSGATVVLPATLMAALAEEDYTLREIGVYARDPEEGEILYRLYRLSPAVPIAAGGSLVLRLELAETVSEAAQVTVEGTAVGLLTQADLDALRGAVNGLATLNGEGIVPSGQLPGMDFAPSVHAGRHASGGADPITPASIGASAAGHSHAWSEVTGKPTTFTPAAHSHAAGDVTSGTFAADRIPALVAGKITSGTFDAARIPTLAAGKVTTGTFAATGVKAANGTDYTTARVRNMQADTTDLTAGSSALANGDIYLVYE